MIRDYFIVVIVCGITILVYKYMDPNKDVERFYHRSNTPLYLLHKFAYVVIMLAMALNIKALFNEVKPFLKFFK